MSILKKEFNIVKCDKCKYCNGSSGTYSISLQRCTQLYDWNGDPFEHQMEYKSGGAQIRCIDCNKVIKKFKRNV